MNMHGPAPFPTQIPPPSVLAAQAIREPTLNTFGEASDCGFFGGCRASCRVGGQTVSSAVHALVMVLIAVHRRTVADSLGKLGR